MLAPPTSTLSAAKHVSSNAGAVASGSTLSDVDLMELLRSHNAKVRSEMKPAKPAYEPRTQSVAAMREWERRTGKKYASLSYAERWEANQEINAKSAEAQTTETMAVA